MADVTLDAEKIIAALERMPTQEQFNRLIKATASGQSSASKSFSEFESINANIIDVGKLIRKYGVENADAISKSMTSSKVPIVVQGMLLPLIASVKLASKGLDTFADLSNVFLKGKSNLSSYTGVFTKLLESVPGVGTALAALGTVITNTIAVFEHYNKVFFEVSKSGASFNNDLMLMRTAAAQTGLSLEEYAGIVSQNAKAFSAAGSVTTGALKFSQVSKEMVTKFGPALMDMGVGLRDMNESVALYMELNQAGARANEIEKGRMAEGARNLLVEMDGLAKLTGKSRKEQADALKKQQASAAFQMAMARMEPKEREKITALQARATTMFGDTAGDVVTQMVLGMGPMTEQTKMLAATQPELYAQLQNMVNSAKDTGQSFEQFAGNLDAQTADAVEAAMKSGTSLEGVLKAAAAGMGGSVGEISKVQGELLQNSWKYMNSDNTINKQKLMEDLKKVKTEQKTANQLGSAINKVEVVFTKLRGIFFEKIITPLATLIAPVIEKIGTLLTAGVEKIAEFLDSFKFSALVKSLFGSGENISNSIADFFKSIDFSSFMGNIFKTIMPKVKETGEVVLSFFKAFWDGLTAGFSGGEGVGDIKNKIKDIFESITKVLNFIVTKTAPLVEPVVKFSTAVARVAGKLLAILGKVFMAVIPKFFGVIQTIFEPILTYGIPLVMMLYDAVTPVIEFFELILDWFNALISGGSTEQIDAAKDKISEAVSSFVNTIVEYLKRVWDMVVNGFKSLMSGIIDAIPGAKFIKGLISGEGKPAGPEAAPPPETPPPMFASGGIASGPATGYKALLHGLEAVVPLPEGKSIPVSLNQSEDADTADSFDGKVFSDMAENQMQLLTENKILKYLIEEQNTLIRSQNENLERILSKIGDHVGVSEQILYSM